MSDWDATETGWRCTKCGHEISGVIDARLDAAHDCPPTVPRVAKSLDELRVGQVVAWFEESENEWKVLEVDYDGDEICWEFTGTEVVLSDPPPEPVTVSREAFDRLADLSDRYATEPNTQLSATDIARAARDLIAEVRADA